jgi:hypothetical protein
MSRQPGRASFFVNAGVSLLMIAVVAAVALVVNPPSPPGIAAFAPQAAKPITKAPPGQASVSGTSGAGACSSAGVCPPSPTPRPTKAAASPKPPHAPGAVSSTMQCVEWPDGSVTQTFDPQSPPCIASWSDAAQGNGGATSTGVTPTTVRVAFPRNPSNDSMHALAPIVDFFNSRFELYGRRIQLVPFDSKETTAEAFADSNQQHADAVQAASMNVFASLDRFDLNANTPTLSTFLDTLAGKHVIGITGGVNAPFTSEQALASHAPYEWSYSASVEDLMRNTGNYTCTQLTGHPARSSADYASTLRKFAVFLPDSQSSGGGVPGVKPLRDTMAACGLADARVVYYDPSGSEAGARSIATQLNELKSAGVTTLLYFPWLDGVNPTSPQHTADRIAYHPEWVAINWSPWITASLLLEPSPQTAHTFGVGNWNKLYAPQFQMWGRAFADAGGSLQQQSKGALQGAETLYHELLLLASGIQMAGPHLTPTSFASALHQTVFPNPGAGRAPTFQGTVGFAGRSSSMVKDYLVAWINPSATTQTWYADQPTFTPNDVFCYAELGRRNAFGHWSRNDGAYRGPCR